MTKANKKTSTTINRRNSKLKIKKVQTLFAQSKN